MMGGKNLLRDNIVADDAIKIDTRPKCVVIVHLSRFETK
tara:strand:+ start:268 stop:384 length:117 start_codon:yes stop_codon:yes gene_type:complete